jgi:hypothetical protein
MADHKGVVAVFGDLPPEIFVLAKRRDRLPDFLVVLVDPRSLGVDLVRRLQASIIDEEYGRNCVPAATRRFKAWTAAAVDFFELYPPPSSCRVGARKAL